MRRLIILTLSLFPALALALPMENKWRLQFSGGAEQDGRLVFVITPAEGPARRVEIAVRDSAGENEVADIVRDGLKDAIGDDYRVEVDDGEDVLVKRRWFRPRFNIALAENTIDVRINFDQE